MQPGDFYQLAIVATALFVAPFNAMARVVVLSWIVAHVGFVAGLSEPLANLAGQLWVAVQGRRHLRCLSSGAAWGCSILLIAVNGFWLAGAIEPPPAWWTVLTVAFLQLTALPFAIDTATLKAVTRAWYESTGRGLFRAGHAR